MTNNEKVKRILDAGHWVKVTYDDGTIITVTSYHTSMFSYIKNGQGYHYSLDFVNCTIEVIQRIPTAYKAGEKVLVLSNPSPSCIDSQYIDMMVGKVGTIKGIEGFHYSVYNYGASDYFYFPAHCLAPVFDDLVSDTQILSGKEATIVIDGKEYTCVIK